MDSYRRSRTSGERRHSHCLRRDPLLGGENVVDGVLARLFWAMLLGTLGAWLHKVASTLDAMPAAA
ncbi:MAG: cobalamin biosynthesis protein [Thermoleophilia bacterium]